MDRSKIMNSCDSMRVLHVDDEPMICDVTRLCLEREGKFTVDVVHNPDEALALLKEHYYACVISDYEMPSMNGLQLLKEIRSFDSDIPFILFSGRGRETVVIEAINNGADFYIQKGGDAKSLFAELNHKVDYAISKRNSRTSLKRRDAILEAVSLVATMFLQGEDYESAMNESLTLFGLATEVDKVMVFTQNLQEGNSSSFQCINAWSRLGKIDNTALSSITSNPDFNIENITQGKPLIGSIDTLSKNDNDIFCQYNIRSLAAFPIIVGRDIRGMIWFCDCLTQRDWAPIEIDSLQAAASIIGSALRNEELIAELTQGKKQYESMYAMMRQLCDTVPDMLWAKDTEDKYIFVNKETSKKLLNCESVYEPLNHKESEFVQMFVSSEKDRPINYSEGTTDQNQVFSPIPEKDVKSGILNGKPAYIDIRKAPFFSDNGEYIGTVAVGRDITHEKKREEELIIERKKYAHIFHKVHIGLITCLPDGEITEINKRAAFLLGNNCVAMHGVNLNSLPGLCDIGFFKDLMRAQAIKDTINGKGNYLDKNGNARILHYGIQPEINTEEKVVQFLITIDEHYQN